MIPPSWLGWKTPATTESNWSLHVIIFSISLPKVFKSTMGWNIWGEEWFSFPGLGIITEIDSLKAAGHRESLMHALAIDRNREAHFSEEISTLRWPQVI